MPIKSKYLFVASMDVDADKEALFHEVRPRLQDGGGSSRGAATPSSPVLRFQMA